MPYKVNLPQNINCLLDVVSKDERPENEADFWQTVAAELSMLINYASHAEQPQIVFGNGNKIGSQYIWEFYVNDLAKPRKEAMRRNIGAILRLFVPG